MSRNRSASVNRRPNEKKKMREKYQHCLHIFKAIDAQNKHFSDSNSDLESVSSLSADDSPIPLQQGNIIYNQPFGIDQDVSYGEFWNMTPPNAFALLPLDGNPIDMALLNQNFPVEISGIIDPVNSSLQNQPGMVIDDMSNLRLRDGFPNINFATTVFNPTTVPITVDQNNEYQHSNGNHYHHEPSHYQSDPLITIKHHAQDYTHNQNSGNNNVAENVVETSPFSQPSTPQQEATTTQTNFVPCHQSHRSDTPVRYNPPLFQDGPRYFQATESFRSCFSQVDADDSGFISLEELRVFLQNKDRTSFNDEALLIIMDMFDNNNDNMIDGSEFPDMLAFVQNWSSCFTFLDRDKSGTIDYSEMITTIKALGFTSLSHQFIVKLVKKYDRTHRGQIELDNFILACVTLYRCKDTYEFMNDRFGSNGAPRTLEQFINFIFWSPTSY